MSSFQNPTQAELLKALEKLMEHYDTGISWAYNEGALDGLELGAAMEAGEEAHLIVNRAKKDGRL